MKELTASGSKEKDDWEDNDAKEKKRMNKGYLNRKSFINQDNKVRHQSNRHLTVRDHKRCNTKVRILQHQFTYKNETKWKLR